MDIISINLKKILTLFFLGIAFFLLSSITFGQETQAPPEQIDSEEDLTFPISELGGCEDYGSCLSYCDDPVNHASCMVYARERGFYETDPVIAPTDEFWTETEGALGCNSEESCLEFCSQEENYDECHSFAEENDVIGGYVREPDNPEYLNIARDVLGCDSAESCSNFCDDPANAQRCSDFAGQVGLLGGQITIGPGGCNSSETCDNYCRDPNNFSSCAVFAPPNATYTGPGGCNSPQSCRSHCEENPADCRSYAPGSNGVYVPAVCPANQFFGPGGVCPAFERTQEAGSCAQAGNFWDGDSCSNQAPPGIHPTIGGAYFQPRPEMGNCATPGSCYDYCKSNPGQCQGFDSSGQRPTDDYIPTLYYTPGTEVKFAPKAEMGNCNSPGSCYDYCRENPGKCEGFSSNSPRPVDTYMPGTYYTPPSNYTYFTPPATGYYVTPIYYTPPAGSNYTKPTYYTPGQYYTPAYYTPYSGINYTTPTYYTPGTYYSTPTGQYPTPQYLTPVYYTPPEGSNYTTPSYYTPPPYYTPYYYTPSDGSYTTPSYSTPPPYVTPTYYTPSGDYPTPSYYYPTPGSGYSYPSPSYAYPTPGGSYSYPTPGSYSYPTPGSYSYPTPYGTPSYGTPESYQTPSYGSPSYGTPSYEYPSPYSYPTPVQGVSKQRGLFDMIWDFLAGK